MPTPTFEIGANVFAADGRVGRLSHVAVDAHSHHITDLIVEAGRVLKEDRVIPADAVERVDEKGIHLRIACQEADACPPYHESDFAVPEDEVGEEMGYHGDEALAWVWRYGVAAAAPFMPSVKERVGRQPGDEAGARVLVGRGSRVYNDEGTIGSVHHLLLDRETGKVRYLVVRRGPLPFRAVIPAEMVGRFDEDGVYVAASREELQAVERYAPRPDAEIQEEVEARLAQEEGVDPRTVRVRLKDGLVRLAGSVSGALGRRRVEEVAAGVPGAVGVESELVADEEAGEEE